MLSTSAIPGYMPNVGDSNNRPVINEGLSQKTLFYCVPSKRQEHVYFAKTSGLVVTDTICTKKFTVSPTVEEFFFKSRPIIGNTTDWSPSVLKFSVAMATERNGLLQKFGMFDDEEGVGFGYNGTSFGIFRQDSGSALKNQWRVTVTGVDGTVNVNGGGISRAVATLAVDSVQATAFKISQANAPPILELQGIGTDILLYQPINSSSTTNLTRGTNTSFSYNVISTSAYTAPTLNWFPVTLPSWFVPQNMNIYSIEFISMLGFYRMSVYNPENGTFQELYTFPVSNTKLLNKPWIPFCMNVKLDPVLVTVNVDITVGSYSGLVPSFDLDTTNNIRGTLTRSIINASYINTYYSGILVPLFLVSPSEPYRWIAPTFITSFKTAAMWTSCFLLYQKYFGNGYEGALGNGNANMPFNASSSNPNVSPIVVASSNLLINYFPFANTYESIVCRGGYGGSATASLQAFYPKDLIIWPGQQFNVGGNNDSAGTGNTVYSAINYKTLNLF